MFKAEFELEAITPIFMRGADQTKAEIRSSSIKGLMRWWFRALAGNYFGNDVDKLREAEEEIFGSTKRRSGVVVEVNVDKVVEANDKYDKYKLKPIKAEYEITYDRRRNVLRTKAKSIKIHLIKSKDSNYEEIEEVDLPNYLFFSIKMFIDEIARNCLETVLSRHGIRNRFNNEDHMKSILRKRGLNYPTDLEKEFQKEFNQNVLKYYPAGTKFQLKIKALDERSFRIALASLWAFVTLGGIGFRSRRGAGSIGVVKVKRVYPEKLKEKVEKFFEYDWRSIKEASLFWDSSFKQLCNKFDVENIVEEDMFRYPSIRKLTVLECSKFFDTYIGALLKLEQAYAGELKGSGKHSRYVGGIRFEFADKNFSHTVIERFKQNSELEENTTERRFYFGLPLIYSNWKTEVNGYNEINSRNPFRRRGSSIILTVKKDGEKYVPIVVILPYQFLPNHEGRFVAVKRNRNLVFQLATNNDWFVKWLKKNVVEGFEKRGFVKVYPKE